MSMGKYHVLESQKRNMEMCRLEAQVLYQRQNKGVESVKTTHFLKGEKRSAFINPRNMS